MASSTDPITMVSAQEMDQARRYQYVPLQPTANDQARPIRLLCIHPALFEEDIHLDLNEVCVGNNTDPQYEALSYVWGSQENPLSVYVGPDRRCLLVTANLALALRHLRHRNKPRVVWVDAVCIDQTNAPERNQQVAMMGDIYSRANNVIVWLGPQEQDSTHALQLMAELASKVNVNWKTLAITPSDTAPSDQHWSDKYSPLPYDKKDLDALAGIFLREWFERLWTRQEIILAREAIIQCGTYIMSWELFRRALFVICGKDQSSIAKGSELSSWVSRVRGRLRLLYQVCTTRSTSLNDLRYNFGASLCQDARDRIYGVLRILDVEDRSLGIVPDYSLDKNAVYQDVVLRYVNARKDLNIMLQCEPAEPYTTPTWVPDWSVYSKSKTPLAWLASASGNLMTHVEIQRNMLRATGVIVDKVQKTTNFDAAKFVGPLDIFRVLQEIVPAGAADVRYVNDGSLLDGFVRTLLRDYLKDFLLLPGVSPNIPSLAQATERMRLILSGSHSTLQELSRDPIASLIAGFAAESLGNYCLFITQKGYVGLGPHGQVLAGDEVSTLLGCDLPMLVRQRQDKKYHVVGQAYVCGLMYGEGILGPLPSHFRLSCTQYDTPAGSKLVRAYLNLETGTKQHEDPRLPDKISVDFSAARRDWDRGKDALVDVNSDVLRGIGIDVQWLDLL